LFCFVPQSNRDPFLPAEKKKAQEKKMTPSFFLLLVFLLVPLSSARVEVVQVWNQWDHDQLYSNAPLYLQNETCVIVHDVRSSKIGFAITEANYLPLSKQIHTPSVTCLKNKTKVLVQSTLSQQQPLYQRVEENIAKHNCEILIRLVHECQREPNHDLEKTGALVLAFLWFMLFFGKIMKSSCCRKNATTGVRLEYDSGWDSGDWGGGYGSDPD
jgi:hypothetical protein